MKRMMHAAAIAALASAMTAMGAGIGEELPALVLKDGAGHDHTIDNTLQRIYANADRKGDELMKTAMAGLGQAQLDAQKAAVIADISEAPFFIKSIIRSSVKDRRYSTWLDANGSTEHVLPYRENQVTVIDIEQRRVKAIRYVSDAGSLKRELAAPAPVPAQ